MLFLIDLIMCVITVTVAGSLGNITNNMNLTPRPTRRILNGQPVGDTRPYMIYLTPAPIADAKLLELEWICGGVIIHPRHILTSAACIEDAKHFYVISGTNKWSPVTDKDNECVKNGAKKAVWKCVPKAYYFDGKEFDNIRWMEGDIAVVKVEDDFNFEKRVRGCDFIPKMVAYNNRSMEFEKPRSQASIAGWGSKDAFSDLFQDKGLRKAVNSPVLLESESQLISAKNCKKRWEPRYHYVIDDYMICSKDISDEETLSAVCLEREINCKEMEYSSSDEYDENDDDKASPQNLRHFKPQRDKPPNNKPNVAYRRTMPVPGQLKVHTARHLHDARRTDTVNGGFCENDHGGPLIVGQGLTSMVIGVMSACLTRDVSRKCYGPFLYTSVYRYRNLISCAINKDIGATCRNFLRTSKTPMIETYFDWSKHKDILTLRSFGKRYEEAQEKVSAANATSSSTTMVTDAM